MAIFFTIFSGVTVFVLGQILIRLVIEPVQEVKKTKGNVQFSMSKLAHIIHNPTMVEKEVRSATFLELRVLSARLSADLTCVPYYDLTRKIFNLPELSKARDACTNIIAVSNWLGSTDNSKQFAYISKNVQELHDNLEIFYPQKERISPELLEQFIKHQPH